MAIIQIYSQNNLLYLRRTFIFSHLRPISFVSIASTSNNYINSIKGETRGGGECPSLRDFRTFIGWCTLFSIFPGRN